jgi:hypothetical protein
VLGDEVGGEAPDGAGEVADAAAGISGVVRAAGRGERREGLALDGLLLPGELDRLVVANELDRLLVHVGEGDLLRRPFFRGTTFEPPSWEEGEEKDSGETHRGFDSFATG